MSGAGSMYKKRYWELYARKVISTETAGIASRDMEKELHSIVCFVYSCGGVERASSVDPRIFAWSADDVSETGD